MGAGWGREESNECQHPARFAGTYSRLGREAKKLGREPDKLLSASSSDVSADSVVSDMGSVPLRFEPGSDSDLETTRQNRGRH